MLTLGIADRPLPKDTRAMMISTLQWPASIGTVRLAVRLRRAVACGSGLQHGTVSGGLLFLCLYRTDQPFNEPSIPVSTFRFADQERRDVHHTLIRQRVHDLVTESMDDRQLPRRYLRPAAKRLGIYFLGFGWRTFRRQNLTVIQEEGANPLEAMAQAGHSRLVMTGEYTIVGLKRREKAVRKLQQRLFQTGIQKAD